MSKAWRSRSKQERKGIQKYRLEKAALLRALKNGPCRDCGQEFPPEAMDFDHVPGRGGKLGGVGTRGTLAKIIAEARKCDLVCANCHRVRTRRRALGKHKQKADRWAEIDALSEVVEREREALRNLQDAREEIAQASAHFS